MPRLRKDRGPKTRWGVQYYAALRNAVFMIRTPPYVPPEPPPSLNKYDTELVTQYACPQCKDRFHFRSSLEDHRARKSWILGYWCQHCFATVCTHDSKEGSLCSACSKLDRDKRMYLRNKGLHKTQKFGSVQLFFNQCQFLEHVKAHSVSNVNMSDLMLMPIPTNLSQNWDPEINTSCKAIMEHTFIMKVHIMDWLKDENVDGNWWQITNKKSRSEHDLVSSIIRDYKGRQYFKPLQIPMEEQVHILNNKSVTNFNSKCIEIVDAPENVEKLKNPAETATSISDDNEIENEDTPCTMNDIAFVDCGPTSNHFEPESSTNVSRRQVTVPTKPNRNYSIVPHMTNLVINKSKRANATQWKSISSDMVMSYGNTMITPTFDTKDSPKSPANKKSTKTLADRSSKISTPIKLITESNTVGKGGKTTIEKNVLIVEPLSKVLPDASCTSKTDKAKLDKFKKNASVVTVNSGQKYVTFHNTLHIDINTIINQLPAHVVGNKKIYLLGQDSKPILVNNKDETSSKKMVQLVPDGSRGNGMKSKSLTLKSSDKGSTKSTKAVPAVKQTQLTKSKIICHNGTKFSLKQAQGTAKSTKSKYSPNIMSKEQHEASQSKSTCSIPLLIPLKSAESESLSTSDRVNALHGDVSPLTPSPSPSELSSSSSCDTQSKQTSLSSKGAQKAEAGNSSKLICKFDQSTKVLNCGNSGDSLSFHKGEDENLYLDMRSHAQKPIYTIVDSATMISKAKHSMLNEFFHLSYTELKKRYDHLQQLNKEVRAVMDFVPDSVVKDSLKRVNILQLVLKQCIDKCNNKIDDGSVQDFPLENWEEEYNRSGVKTLCKACEKPRKPESYIPGFSKITKNDIYCSCYRHVCHKCNTYQGNSTRFVAHQTFHDKEKPYLCPDCYRKFMLFTSLETHTWTSCFHPLKKRVLGCKICEIDGFRDMETVARHFAVMHSQNKIACEKCYIVLPSYGDYQKHYTDKHPNTSPPGRPVRLVLCKLGRCIVRSEEYMLHMEKHLVVQRLIWFTCPFCSFLHVEAKRIMSHLQNEHLLQLSQIISPQVLFNILPPELSADNGNNPTPGKIEKFEDGTVMPKIVNTRTITSEVFERGTEEPVEYLPVKDSGQHPRALRIATKLADSDKSMPKILEVRSIADRSGSESPVKGFAVESEMKREKIIKIKDEDVVIEQAKAESGSRAQKRKSGVGCSKKLDYTSRERNIEPMVKVEVKEEHEEVENDMESEDNPVSLSKPPPLARIPQRVVKQDGISKSAQTSKAGRMTMLARSQRLALNGPTRTSETALNFLCPLCNEMINTSWSVVSSHFEKKHSQSCKLTVVSPTLVRMSPDFINGGYKDLLGNRKRKAENAATNAKRRRRWTPKKYSEGRSVSFAGTGLCVTQETAEDSEGNFRCKKCDQRCTDMAHLREHIATAHRIRGRYLICLECGDNFVVAPSLQMHLKAFHGIEDPIAYMAKNTSYAPDSIDDLDVEGKAIEANQCHVCMAVFEDKAAVDKHLRVHGMAFLNRKRIEAQNAMKRPEKKDETDEEKQQASNMQNETPTRKGKPAEMILDKINATI